MRTLAGILLVFCLPASLTGQASIAGWAPHAFAPSDVTDAQSRELEAVSGTGPVLVGAMIGAFVPTAIWSVRQIGSEFPSPAGTFSAVWGSGAAVGAMIGAAIGGRKAAPLWTSLGAAVATAPFILFAPDSDDWNRGIFVFVLALPVAGAVIGNGIGQSK